MMNINQITFNIKYENFNKFIEKLTEEIMINKEIDKPEHPYLTSEHFLKIYFINIFHTLYCGKSTVSPDQAVQSFHYRVLGCNEFKLKGYPKFEPAVIAYSKDLLNDTVIKEFIPLFKTYTNDFNTYLKSFMTQEDIDYLYANYSALFKHYLQHNNELIGQKFEYAMYYISMFKNIPDQLISIILDAYPMLTDIEQAKEFMPTEFWYRIFQNNTLYGNTLSVKFIMKHIDYLLAGKESNLKLLTGLSVFFDLPTFVQQKVRKKLAEFSF